jgi:hypothetical protein
LEIKRLAALPHLPAERKRELIRVCERIGNWFGKRRILCVGELNGKIQKEYIADRAAPSAATRDLKILAAAINRNITEEMGVCKPSFGLPSKPCRTRANAGFPVTRPRGCFGPRGGHAVTVRVVTRHVTLPGSFWLVFTPEAARAISAAPR